MRPERLQCLSRRLQPVRLCLVVNTLCSTERATQLAISLVNQPGKLATVCNALAKAEIDIRALTVLETWGDNSILRTVVSDAVKAMASLEEAGVSALETEVLMVETENKPGALARLAEQLGHAGINIEDAYLAATAQAERACIIVRPSDIDKAQQVLS